MWFTLWYSRWWADLSRPNRECETIRFWRRDTGSPTHLCAVTSFHTTITWASGMSRVLDSLFQTLSSASHTITCEACSRNFPGRWGDIVLYLSPARPSSALLPGEVSQSSLAPIAPSVPSFSRTFANASVSSLPFGYTPPFPSVALLTYPPWTRG